MTALLEVARITYIEAIRHKVFYGVLLFLVILLLVSSALAAVTMGRTELMVLDIGLACISLLGNLMAIVLTIQTMQQEKDNRTLYVLLTRLPWRWQYIVGKFCGLVTVLAVQVVTMCALLALFVATLGSVGWVSFAQACVATLLEVGLVAGIALIFAQTSTLFLAVILTISVDVVGRFTSVLSQFGEQSDSTALYLLTQITYYILPNLEAVNLRAQAGYIATYGADRIAAVAAYGVMEMSVLVLLATLIFQRRDLS